MYLQEEIINELNELSLQYSRWFITYEDYKKKRYELLEKLENSDEEMMSQKSVIKDMVSSISDLIKRY